MAKSAEGSYAEWLIWQNICEWLHEGKQACLSNEAFTFM